MIYTNNTNYIYCDDNNKIFIINDNNIPNDSVTKLVASNQTYFTINNNLSNKIIVYYNNDGTSITIDANSTRFLEENIYIPGLKIESTIKFNVQVLINNSIYNNFPSKNKSDIYYLDIPMLDYYEKGTIVINIIAS